jgi:hypothetical protein
MPTASSRDAIDRSRARAFAFAFFDISTSSLVSRPDDLSERASDDRVAASNAAWPAKMRIDDAPFASETRSSPNGVARRDSRLGNAVSATPPPCLFSAKSPWPVNASSSCRATAPCDSVFDGCRRPDDPRCRAESSERSLDARGGTGGPGAAPRPGTGRTRTRSRASTGPRPPTARSRRSRDPCYARECGCRQRERLVVRPTSVAPKIKIKESNRARTP